MHTLLVVGVLLDDSKPEEIDAVVIDAKDRQLRQHRLKALQIMP